MKTPKELQAQYTGPWKQGDEFLPYHHQASHVPPDHRDGWNAGYWSVLAASQRVTAAPLEGVSEANLLKVIDERDSYHDHADALAERIATLTGVDIGEHTSANNPWLVALQAADDFQRAPASPQPLAPPPGEATRLLYRAMRQLERWSEKYGKWNPSWLPPAGDVELAEDIEEYIAKRSVPAAPPTVVNGEPDPLEGIYKPAAKAAVDTLIALGYKFGQNESGYGLAWNPPAAALPPGRGMVPMTESRRPSKEWYAKGIADTLGNNELVGPMPGLTCPHSNRSDCALFGGGGT